jgi:hypothetical protein
MMPEPRIRGLKVYSKLKRGRKRVVILSTQETNITRKAIMANLEGIQQPPKPGHLI